MASLNSIKQALRDVLTEEEGVVDRLDRLERKSDEHDGITEVIIRFIATIMFLVMTVVSFVFQSELISLMGAFEYSIGIPGGGIYLYLFFLMIFGSRAIPKRFYTRKSIIRKKK